MNYQYLLAHKELFPAAVGITYSQFEAIYQKFAPALQRINKQKRQSVKYLRAPGGGRKAKLATGRQKLFFILFYYKVYPTFRLAQALFCLDKINCFRWKERLEPVLFAALGYELKLPKVRCRYLSQALEVCPALKKFLIDASERPVRRPKKPDDQTKYYSGKKKRHTVKNQIIVQPGSKRILAVSKTVEGKRHDKKLAETDGILAAAPPGSVGVGDSGYLGLGGFNRLIKFLTPKRKPQGQNLSEADKGTNTVISSIRTQVEHPFAYMKHFNILSHVFRNQISRSHQPFATIACIYNFNLNRR